jgi:putative ABC transport system permease protein
MFLALRELKYAKLRYFLIALIMILIGWLVLFVSGLANGLASDNASAIKTMNTDYLVVQEDSDNRLNRSILLEEKFHDIHQYLNETAATPLGVQMARLTKNESSKKIDATFFAIDVNSMLSPDLVEGKMINNTTTNEVVVDQSFKNNGFEIGDYVTDQASGKAFEIVGFTKGQSYSHTPVIHINFKEWASINRMMSSQSPSSRNKLFNAIALTVNHDKAQQIEKEVSGISVISKDKALEGIPGYQQEQGSLLMMIVFLFVIAAIVLAVFFYVITIQKINQFGVLKAIGAKSSHLARNIIFQVLALSILSLVISVALTYSVSAILPASMPFDLNPQLALICSMLFLAVSVVGSLLSLYRVIKIDAIEAIGRAA